MPLDLRAEAARYYDLNPNVFDDIPFYMAHLPGSDARVLELGCGTGRVSLPLAEKCGFLYGLDLSEAMLDLCREKIVIAKLSRSRIVVEHGDITNYALNTQFDLIIAPFRVIQNLETDDQLDGLFHCIRAHLAPQGRCILNVFHPNRPREELLRTWATDEEKLAWEVKREGERMTCHDARRRLVKEPLVVYPELIYRRWREEEMLEEVILPIPMRCYYPQEFLDLIRSAGFTITGSWGGYASEPYGQGKELVVEFSQ
ncbi:class I SAM-dependent methyltransferase [Candidatus Bipolaricaulota bacterium]|nr:class I SAM-dependent methyltransferase [Candidatus Bipolaricaulota bacterium]